MPTENKKKRFWRVLNTQGVEYFLQQEDAPPGEEVDEIDRFPVAEKGERFDRDTRKIVHDPELEADRAHTPVGHKEEAHILKALEATMILSGHTLTHGLIVEEAEALGVNPLDLATEVHNNSKVFRDAEVLRRRVKTGKTKPEKDIL